MILLLYIYIYIYIYIYMKLNVKITTNALHVVTLQILSIDFLFTVGY
jgi:hypothetical protein